MLCTKVFIRLFSVFGLALLIGACTKFLTPTPVPQVPDDSLLTQSPCAPPCWQGLVPGTNTLEEAQTVLKNSFVVRNNATGIITSTYTKWASVDWWWFGESRSADRGNYFDFNGHRILQNIFIVPNIGITFSDVVRKYGVPTYILINLIRPYDVFSDPHTGFSITVLYAQNGMFLYWFIDSEINTPLQFCLRPDSIIMRTRYMAPKITEAEQNSLADMPSPNLLFQGDSIVHLTDGKVSIDCVPVK